MSRRMTLKSLCPLDLHLRDRRLDGELLAVGPQAADRPEVAHARAVWPVWPKWRMCCGVGSAEALGDEAVDRAAHSLGRRAAEHLLGRRVEQHDALLLIDGDDGIHRRVDDPGQPLAALGQRLFGSLCAR